MMFLSYLHFFASVVYSYMAISVYVANRKAKINKACSVLFICFSIWTFSMVFIHNPYASIGTVEIFSRIGIFGWAFIMSAFLWFLYALEENEKMLKSPVFFMIAFLVPFVFVYIRFKGGLLYYVKNEYGWDYIWLRSFPVYMLWIYIVVLGSLSLSIILRLWFKTRDALVRRRYQIMFASGALVLLVSVGNDIAIPYLGIAKTPGISNLLALLWAIGVVYNMVKYKFLMLTPEVASDNIINSMTDCVLLVDYEGKVVFSNQSVFALLGYEPSEIMGAPMTRLFASTEIKPNMLKTYSSEIGTSNYDTVFKSKDGSLTHVNLSASILKDKTGVLIGFAFIARDISERKRFDEEIAVAYKTTKNIVENAPFGIYIVNQEGNIDYVNPAMLHISGDNYEEFKSINVFENPRYIDIGLTDNIKVGLKGRYFRMDSVKYRSFLNNRETVRNFTGIPLEEGGENKLLMIVEDITTRKRAQQELKKAYEDLQHTQAQLIQSEKMAGIGQLSAGIAHEINNPVGFIISNLEVMKDYINSFSQVLKELESMFNSDMSREEMKARFEEMKRDKKIQYISDDFQDIREEVLDGAVRIKNIVANLKSFSHPHEEKMEPTDINQEIEKALFLVSNELKYHCEVVKKLGKVPKVFVNRSQLIQVFVNLLINSAQAIEDKGVVTVETFLEGAKVCIRFSDTGKGIPEEIKNKVFEPFFTTKKIGEGTGLGLSIAFGIIRNHKGSIELDSTCGEGTAFTIKLPVDENFSEEM